MKQDGSRRFGKYEALVKLDSTDIMVFGRHVSTSLMHSIHQVLLEQLYYNINHSLVKPYHKSKILCK